MPTAWAVDLVVAFIGTRPVFTSLYRIKRSFAYAMLAAIISLAAVWVMTLFRADPLLHRIASFLTLGWIFWIIWLLRQQCPTEVAAPDDDQLSDIAYTLL